MSRRSHILTCSVAFDAISRLGPCEAFSNSSLASRKLRLCRSPIPFSKALYCALDWGRGGGGLAGRSSLVLLPGGFPFLPATGFVPAFGLAGSFLLGKVLAFRLDELMEL